MITIEFSPEDLSNVRFAYSPLVETSISYFLLHCPNYLPLQSRWADEARRAIHGMEFPYLNALATTRSFIPDFLTPTPEHVRHNIEADIQQMLETPIERIRYDINFLIGVAGENEFLQNFLAYPREMMQCVADDLRLYWQRAIQPHWSQMTSTLEGDILYRARQLAIDGTAKVFEDLTPITRYEANKLEINKPHREEEYQLNGQGIHLVPTVFPTKHLWWQVSPGYKPMIIYNARGIGQWKEDAPQRNQALELLVGAGRASVLLGLVPPVTTTELAYKLHMTAGAVSQHLDKLNQTGLVDSRRSGKRVYYHLTKRGEKLLELFDGQYR